MSLQPFHFKKFSIEQAGAAHPVGTDAVLLGAWADLDGARRVLDIGAGTGIVSLMLAQRSNDNPATSAGLSLTAVEIHPPSAALARRNFDASPWRGQLEVWEGAIQDFCQTGVAPFDLIVSNPPFFSELTVSPDDTRSLGRHTATLSSVDLLTCAALLLAPKGRFCVVLPWREGLRLCELAVPLGLYWTKFIEVESRPGKPVERLLLQFEKSPYGLERRTFSHFAVESGYSETFQRLTKDFYL